MAGVSAGRFGQLGRAASFARRQFDIGIGGCLTMPAALLSTTETKNRPAANRAVKGAVFDSIHPAGGRDNHEIDNAENIDADCGRQAP